MAKSRKIQEVDSVDVEVSVAVSIIDQLDINNLPEIIGWREKQLKLVEENPYIEITDSKTYKIACDRRTNLLKGRTELEKQDKGLASKLAEFRKAIGSETKNLVVITYPSEEKQQAEVKRWEGVKQALKEEEERLESLRIDNIKKEVEIYESSCYELIQKSNFETIVSTNEKLQELSETEFDFEEYDILFTQARYRIQSLWDSKSGDLTTRENDRLAKIESDRIAAEETSKNQIQAERLKMLLPYIGFGEEVDMTALWTLTDEEWTRVYNSKSQLHFEKQKVDKEIQDKKEADEKAEKDAIFAMRAERLKTICLEIELDHDGSNPSFCNSLGEAVIDVDSVYDARTIEFETIFSDAVSAVEKLKQATIDAGLAEKKAEIEAEEAQAVAERQMIADEEASKADADKLKKENKARVARLAKDKSCIILALEESDYPLIMSPLENKEAIEFFKSVKSRFNDLKTELLVELNKL